MELGNGSTFTAAPTGVPTQIAAVGTAAFEMADHDKVKYYFTAAGLFLGLKDLEGRVITVATSGLTQTITDVGSGRQLFVVWNATPGASTSRIASVRTVPLATHANTSIEWKYYYDANGRLSKACDPRDNAQTGFCYTHSWDASGRLASVVLPKGNVQLALTYHADGKVATRKDGMNNTWSFVYATNVPFTNLAGGTVTASRRTTITDPRV